MHSHDKHACMNTVQSISHFDRGLTETNKKKIVNISGSHHYKYKLLRLCVCHFRTIFQLVDWTALGKVSITRQISVTISICTYLISGTSTV